MVSYDKRIIDKTIFRNGKTKCECCGKEIEDGAIVELLVQGNSKSWFLEGHMLPHVKKIQREFLLSKI